MEHDRTVHEKTEAVAIQHRMFWLLTFSSRFTALSQRHKRPVYGRVEKLKSYGWACLLHLCTGRLKSMWIVHKPSCEHS